MTLRQRRSHRYLLRALAALLLAPMIVWAPQAAHAAGGVRCDKLYGLEDIQPADPPLIPGIDDVWGNDDPPAYEYVNPGEDARFLPDETASWKTNLDELVAKWGTNTRGTKSNPMPSGSPKHAYASRLRYIKNQLAKNEEVLPWEQWLDSNYIPAQGNDPKGKTYERLIVEKYRLTGQDWICQEKIPGAPNGRKYDAVNKRLKIALEFKSGDREVADQVRQDKENVAALKEAGEDWKIHYSFGGEAADATLNRVTSGTNGAITAKVVRADPVVTNANPRTPSDAGKLVNPDPNTPATGAGDEYIQDSPRNAGQASGMDDAYVKEAQEAALDDAEANALSDEEAMAGALENAPLRPGGIDFTTLELRYVSIDGPGVNYAFKGTVAADDVHSSGGLAVGQLSSDALFTWLALPASSFWVNLNPDQPDTIIDPKLARTDAGRVLLQADLQMKKTSAKLVDPNTPLGERYWNSLQSAGDNLPCVTFRNWIVPGPAKVRETDGELYVLDAPLQVKSAPINFKTPIAVNCPAQPDSITEHNQKMYEQYILPEVEKAVNTAPEYEDLRRVYLARVMAEWLRQRSAVKANAYTRIINSGDVSRWPARTPWNPMDVFNAMVKSLKEGEFTYTWHRNQGGTVTTVTIVAGGVDWTQSPRAPVAQTTFNQQYPALPVTVARSRGTLLHDVDPTRTWLGAGTRPVAQPAPPATQRPTLPVTGTPAALIALVGSLLVVAGALLLIALRRRRQPVPGA